MFLRRKTLRPLLVAVIVSASFTALIPGAAAQGPSSGPTSGLINVRGIVFNPATRKVYVVDQADNAVDVIDTARQTLHSVAVGIAPVSIAADPTSGRAYVVNSGDGTVTIIDGTSNRVLATIAVGAHPYSIAANTRTGLVYVSHTFSDRTTVLNATTQAVTQLVTGAIDLIAIDAPANTTYLLGYEAGNVAVLEGPRHALHKEKAGKHSWGMAVNDVAHTLYVARMGTGDVIALHGTSSSVLPAGHTPCSVAVNPRSNTVYVGNYADGTVSALDAKTGRRAATIPVGEHPQALAVDTQRNLVYVANTFSNTVTVIDAARQKAIATLPAGKAPYALAVDPGSARLYVANEAGDRPFTIVDTALRSQ